MRQAIISKIEIEQEQDQFQYRVKAELCADEFGNSADEVVELFLLSGCEHPEAAGYFPVEVIVSDMMIRKIKELTGESSTGYYYKQNSDERVVHWLLQEEQNSDE